MKMPPKKSKPTDCDLCCKHIVEGKEEALQCEGGCNLWFHRYCAGVSASYFAELSNSPEPFVCYACYQRSQLAATKQLQSEVAHLKGEITKLSEQLATLTTASLSEATVSQPLSTDTNKSVNCINNGPTYASTLKQAGNSANSPTSITHAQSSASLKRNNVNPVDKKFNIVLYGACECPKGSPRHERVSHDTNLACKIIKSICPDMNGYAICDCSRIGKYSEPRSRPLCVKFARSCDVAAVLSNRYKLSKIDHPNIFLKPFMTTAERKVESILLKERRTLIDSGIERNQIKIRGNSIYINKTKVGSANGDIFIRCQQLQDQSHDLTPIPHNTSTNNILSATAANSATNHSANTTVNDVKSTNDEHSQRAPIDGKLHSSSPLSTNSN